MQIEYVRLVVIAIVPGIALAIGLYLADRYDREPIGLLVKIFILGAASTIPTFFAERALSYFNIFTGILGKAYLAFIVAGLTEEFFKRSVVILTAFRNNAFNEKLDGIIYSTYSALGFATVENIIYIVFRFSNNSYVGIYRGLLSVPAHMLFAITMGYYLSLSKFASNDNSRKHFFRKSLLYPVVLHGIFDFILLTEIPYLMFIFIPFVIYLWVVNLKKLNIYYKESKSQNKKIIDKY